MSTPIPLIRLAFDARIECLRASNPFAGKPDDADADLPPPGSPLDSDQEAAVDDALRRWARGS